MTRVILLIGSPGQRRVQIARRFVEAFPKSIHISVSDIHSRITQSAIVKNLSVVEFSSSSEFAAALSGSLFLAYGFRHHDYASVVESLPVPFEALRQAVEDGHSTVDAVVVLSNNGLVPEPLPDDLCSRPLRRVLPERIDVTSFSPAQAAKLLIGA